MWAAAKPQKVQLGVFEDIIISLGLHLVLEKHCDRV